MSAAFLWVKAAHIVFVASWFAGLFYLPRLFINLSMVPAHSHAERDRLLVMAHKLMRFTHILMVPAVGLGAWLLLGFQVGLSPSGGLTVWMACKLGWVALALGYHHACARLLRAFQAGTSQRSTRWLRVFNESAVLVFAATVVMVVVKPWS